MNTIDVVAITEAMDRLQIAMNESVKLQFKYHDSDDLVSLEAEGLNHKRLQDAYDDLGCLLC